MGTYSTYGEVQLKVGDDGEMPCFKVGDKTDIADGVYVGYEGAVVIKNGVFVAEFPDLFSKWGDIIECKDVIDSMNPIHVAVKEVVEKHEQVLPKGPTLEHRLRLLEEFVLNGTVLDGRSEKDPSLNDRVKLLEEFVLYGKIVSEGGLGKLISRDGKVLATFQEGKLIPTKGDGK